MSSRRQRRRNSQRKAASRQTVSSGKVTEPASTTPIYDALVEEYGEPGGQ